MKTRSKTVIQAALGFMVLLLIIGYAARDGDIMPDVVGKSVVRASADITEISSRVRIRTDLKFPADRSVSDEEQLTVCSQTPEPGEPIVRSVRLTVATECSPQPEKKRATSRYAPKTSAPTAKVPADDQATPDEKSRNEQENQDEEEPSRKSTKEASSASTPATFDYAIDGDTVETSAGRVRIIGIDTPERGKCGYDEATYAIEDVLNFGDTVYLEAPRGQNDQDHFGRLLRYVITEDGTDVGRMQLDLGNAIARYDSRDGYPSHPKEEEYHDAQIATLNADGSPRALGCKKQAAPKTPAELEGGWWKQYSSCTKLKKNTAGHPRGPFDVNDPNEKEIYDWFAYGTGNNGDGDGDGLACE